MTNVNFSKVNKLFENNFCYDKKHKINTTNKNIPEDILENINNGITLEQINDLCKKGYDIYKYQTQITLHGICKKLDSNTVNYYQALILNKNGSIGIKWNAVDNEKKLKIANTLSYFGWTKHSTSSALHPFIIKRFDNAEDAIKKCYEYNEIANRIDKDLFFGNYNIYVGSYLGIYYAVFDLFINGILENNVNKVLEQILDMDINTINSKIEDIKNERAERLKQYHEKYERENNELKQQAEIYNEKFLQELSNNYKEVNSLSLSNGDIFYVLKKNFIYKYELIGYTFGKRTCKPLSYLGSNNQKYCKSDIKVYIKK